MRISNGPNYIQVTDRNWDFIEDTPFYLSRDVPKFVQSDVLKSVPQWVLLMGLKDFM